MFETPDTVFNNLELLVNPSSTAKKCSATEDCCRNPGGDRHPSSTVKYCSATGLLPNRQRGERPGVNGLPFSHRRKETPVFNKLQLLVNTWNVALENGADLRVNERQNIRHYRARSTEERRRRRRRIIIGASLSEPLLDELAGAFLWYIYIYIYLYPWAVHLVPRGSPVNAQRANVRPAE